MKRFNIDLEAADASLYENGMAEVIVKVTVREATNPLTEFSSLNMSETTMRRLHKMLGNHIRNLDEYNQTLI